MSEMEQIVIGRMLDPMRIKTKQTTVEIDDWAKRAMWSFLRLQYGRNIDIAIKSRRDEWIMENYHIETKMADKSILKKAMEQVFADILSENPVKDPRKIQFIMEGSKVMAVASLKHLLIPPEEVYDIAQRLIEKDYPKLEGIDVAELQGSTYEIKQVAGFKLGVQIFGGDITTRQAISVTSWLRVEQCLNPLSWLGMGAFKSLGYGNAGYDFERVLRIKVRSDLEPRLKDAIKVVVDKQNQLEKRVQTAQRIAVERSDAEIILAAFGLSYSLGVRTIEQILERLDKEPRTQYGMSMASSWVAAHGDLKATPSGQSRVVEQKLGTISGAALMLEDLKEARERSLVWLQAHITQGEVKTLDQLLQKIGVAKPKEKVKKK